MIHTEGARFRAITFAGASGTCIFRAHLGVYLNLVEGLLWVQDVVRSNRTTPTIPGEVALEVRDNGPGVPEAERGNIFKPYVTMRANGVGLGLAIVQQIVAAHRWEITCGANEPNGAVFRITHLKLASAAQ